MSRSVPTVVCCAALLAGALAASPIAAPIAAQARPRLSRAESVKFLPLESVREGRVRLPVALARRVTIRAQRAALRAVLDDVAAQAGLGIGYGEDVTRSPATVTLTLVDGTAADALALAVKGTDFHVYVTAAGEVTVVREEREAVGAVTGRVTERGSGVPIGAAQVTVDGTTLGRSTDAEGRFTIPGVPAGAQTVTVRRIGYEPQSVNVVVTDGGTAAADVVLARAAVSLTGVVVTATGEERRKSVGNALATVDSADIERSRVTNTQQLLAGRVAGATVLANSGQPGVGGSIRLRGVNSVSQGISPIIYVDGVRIFGGRTSTSVAGRQYTSPLNDIPAADIDRVEVVKGPAATTLYGTEASGGVIQIFTKRGAQAGRAQWTADLTGGVNTMGHIGPSSDPTGLFINQCRGANLVLGDGTKFEDPSCPENGSWLRAGAVQRYSLSVRGATGGTTGVGYYLGGNLNDEQAVLPSGGNRDGGLRANVDFAPLRGLRVAVNSSFQKRRVDWYPDGGSSNGVLLNISRGSGSNFKSSGCTDATVVCVTNDSLFTLNSYTDSDHFITGGTVTYDPTPSFSNRLAVGYDYNNADVSTIVPFGYLRVPLGTYFQTLWNRSLVTLDLASTVRHALGASLATTTSVGGQLFDSRLHSTDLQADNFAGPGEPTIISGALRSIVDASQQRVINAGFFGQEQLAWRDRVFLTGGVRVDGNSAFGRSFGLQTYPKLSLAYALSDESFWPRRWVEAFKLRAAVGESGKAPGAFDAVRTWNPVAALNGQSAFTPAQVGNADLGPERTREVEAGFDASALDGRVSVAYTYYDQHTSDALVPVVQAPSAGFTQSQLQNVGQLYNHGNEVSLSVVPVRRRNTTLTAQLRYTTFASRAGDIGGQTLTIDANSRSYVKEGLPVPAYIGPRVRNPNEYAAPVIDSGAFLGATFPTKIVSPQLTLELFRRVTLDALGEWQLGGHLLNGIGYQNAFLNAWQPCYETQAKLRKAAAGDASALADVKAIDRARCTIVSAQRDFGYWVESSDFFKLRTVSATIDLPPRLLNVRRASLVLAGRNLFTSTKYSGTDPEAADQRDNTFSRRDYYVFPPYRTFTASLRASF
jgi:outer membrane receptor protein involved in Fe transport